jgi:MFS family permease
MGVWTVGIMAVTFAWAPWVLYVAAPLVFLANGATIAVGTVLVIALSPREKLGDFMGLYVTVGMLSAALGPVVIALLLGDVWGTRDGSIPNRFELLSGGDGARDHPPLARPRRPHLRRSQYLRLLLG